MILKIISFPKNKDEPMPADTLLIESNKILIVPGDDDNGNLNHTNMVNNEEMKNKPVWKVIHNGEHFLFTDAFLMNNDGKTIERYG
jgi:hypothetical protein